MIKKPWDEARWDALRPVDFLEILQRDDGIISMAVAEQRCSVGEPIGQRTISYEQTWHLHVEADQADLAWLICHRLQPKVIHMEWTGSTPPLISIFLTYCAAHQDASGLGVTLRVTDYSTWHRRCAPKGGQAQKINWRPYWLDGCQWHLRPLKDGDPPPLKTQCWVSNLSLEMLS